VIRRTVAILTEVIFAAVNCCASTNVPKRSCVSQVLELSRAQVIECGAIDELFRLRHMLFHG